MDHKDHLTNTHLLSPKSGVHTPDRPSIDCGKASKQHHRKRQRQLLRPRSPSEALKHFLRLARATAGKGCRESESCKVRSTYQELAMLRSVTDAEAEGLPFSLKIDTARNLSATGGLGCVFRWREVKFLKSYTDDEEDDEGMRLCGALCVQLSTERRTLK
ncbi:hypothetical protein K402DRAFT_222875 [Aulographum hederae CBS 113979]|uniref:Uncharacterized protein n=1 Tax=Aulographum hederae CBS 113979 TaxID=1176131 RepID=A0A6G1GLD7_9PEZI|nr:hypothetical protein K402DRAFT_222875 [Aulographum hederae CBS 113979]